jgi:hypothetical protein
VTARRLPRSVIVMAPRILLCCLVLGLAGCGEETASDDESGPGKPAPATELTVRVDPDGKGPEPAEQAEIVCDADGNGQGCAAAAGLHPADFEPTPADVACTEQFGGPQTAKVTGSLEGERVEGGFSRRDGCEIARWDKLAALLELAG